MIQKLKYSQLFLAFWIQLWLFFTLLPSAIGGQLFAILYILGQLLYFVSVGIYLYCFYNKTVDKSKQRMLEWCVLGLSWLLSALYAGVVYSDPWLWQTTEFIGFDFLVLLIWMTIFLIASTLAIVCHFFPQKSLDVTDNKLWNTYKTADLFFLSIFSLSIIFLTITNTKLVVGIMRDYWQMVRSVGTIVILFMLWYYGRYFVNQRKIFMAALSGYCLFLTIDVILFITIKAPLTRETLVAISEKTGGVTLAIVAMLLHWVFTIVWIIWFNVCEKKAKVKAN